MKARFKTITAAVFAGFLLGAVYGAVFTYSSEESPDFSRPPTSAEWTIYKASLPPRPSQIAPRAANSVSHSLRVD